MTLLHSCLVATGDNCCMRGGVWTAAGEMMLRLRERGTALTVLLVLMIGLMVVPGRTLAAAPGGQLSTAVYPSDGSKFPGWTQWSSRDGGWIDNAKWVAGDFDGDGKTDIAAIWNNGGSNTLTVSHSTGAGFTRTHWATNAGGWLDSTTWLAGDFNGDGKTDIAAVWNDIDQRYEETILGATGLWWQQKALKNGGAACPLSDPPIVGPSPSSAPFGGGSPQTPVGYENATQGPGCRLSLVWQTRVSFDGEEFNKLRMYRNLRLTSADLSFDEQITLDRRNVNGTPTLWPVNMQTTCISRVNVASDSQPQDFLFVFRPELMTRYGPNAGLQAGWWDVLPAVQGWLSDQYPNHGLVIRGRIETFPTNDNACRALLSNFELHLSYTWEG